MIIIMIIIIIIIIDHKIFLRICFDCDDVPYGLLRMSNNVSPCYTLFMHNKSTGLVSYKIHKKVLSVQITQACFIQTDTCIRIIATRISIYKK